MEVENKLRELLVPVLGKDSIDEIQPQYAFVKDMGAESIDFVEIMYVVESNFGVKVNFTEFAQSGISDGDAFHEGKLKAEAADRLNLEFETDHFKAGQSVRELFESLTVKDLVIAIERKQNAQ